MKSIKSMFNRALFVLSVCCLIVSSLSFSTIQYVVEKPTIMIAPPAMIYDPMSFSLNPLLDLMNSLKQWDDFFNDVKQHKNVVIVLNGPGGFVYVLEQVRLMIEQAKNAGVEMQVVVTSMAASADALAVCEFDKATISPYAVLLFHMVSDGEHLLKQDDQFNTCVNKGFITEEELQKMNSGFEVWVTYDAKGNRHVEFKPDTRMPEQTIEG